MSLEKYNQRARKINSLLCVGLDPDFDKIPARFKQMEFPQFEFSKWIIEETNEYAASYKTNSAFYEARGDVGIKELKMTIDYLNKNHPEIFSILDAKRADIGNTNKGYVTSVFDWLKFDAVTLHPYLGSEALAPFLERKDKVSIILCRTSNSGAPEFQDLKSDGKTLWQIVAEKVSGVWNKNNNCMLVVGATYPEEMKKIREVAGDMTFLVPGIGTQGGDLKAVMLNGLNSEGLGLLVSSSSGIIFAENPRAEAQKLYEEINKYKGV